MKEKIQYLRIDSLVPFKNHPFKVRQGEENEELKQSIRERGNVEPLIVRPLINGKYEIISGHRRTQICKELGINEIPVIVRDLTDEEAVCIMVDSNIHREKILPSERAYAYKLKWEAVKKMGLSQVATKRNDEIVARSFGISKDTLHRFIRLTYLDEELLNLVDEGRIAFTPAVELSYLTKDEQQNLFAEIEYSDATPSLSQAQRMRRFSEQGRLSKDVIFAVMMEDKPNQKEKINFKLEDIERYFPRGYTSKDLHDEIIKLLDNRQRKRQRIKEER